MHDPYTQALADLRERLKGGTAVNITEIEEKIDKLVELRAVACAGVEGLDMLNGVHEAVREGLTKGFVLVEVATDGSYRTHMVNIDEQSGFAAMALLGSMFASSMFDKVNYERMETETDGS